MCQGVARQQPKVKLHGQAQFWIVNEIQITHTEVDTATLRRERAGKSIGGLRRARFQLSRTIQLFIKRQDSADEKVLYKGKEVTIIQALSSSPAKLS